jgi:uncharacterized SAM-binding protein YcdF (DUF218 family)
MVDKRYGGLPVMRLAMAVVGALLAGDGFALMSIGVFNFGIVLPFALGVVLMGLAWRWHAVARWRAERPWRQWFWRAGWAGLILWLVSLGLFFQFMHHRIADLAPKASAARAPAAVIILGSGSPNCEVSPTLAARLDEGLRQAQIMPAAMVVVSGGQDFGRLPCTEAGIMGDYLLSHGLAPNRLVREDRSTSTAENMHFSRKLLAQRGVHTTDPVLVVTSDFHLMRAERIARKAGFTSVSGAAAPTPLYIRYNAWLREYFAYISGWLLGEY